MRFHQTALFTALLSVAAIFVMPSSAEAGPKRTKKTKATKVAKRAKTTKRAKAAKRADDAEGYSYTFYDDPLNASGSAAHAAVIHVRKRRTRMTLLRPRTNFIPELLKSVENL